MPSGGRGTGSSPVGGTLANQQLLVRFFVTDFHKGQQMNRLVQSRIFQSFWEIAGGVSVRIKVLGIVLGVILLLSLFVTLQMRAVLYENLLSELIQQGIALNLHMADQVDSLVVRDMYEALDFMLEDLSRHYSNEGHNTEVAYIVAFDNKGDLLASTLEQELPAELLPQSLNVATSSLHDHITYLEMNNQTVLDFATSLPISQGIVRLGLGVEQIHQTVNAVTLQLISITFIMVVVGFAAAFFLTWILTRPILSLVEATKAVSQGNFARQVDRWANDEIGELATAFNAMTRSLAQAERARQERDALRAQYVSSVIIAQEDERKRVARELHDSTSQALTSLLIGMQNLASSLDDPAINQQIETLRGIISQTIDEVRNLAWQLRPSALDDLGLQSAIAHYVEEYQQRYGLHVDFVANGLTGRLPLEMETSIYRIIQEGLTNIARHAQAQHVSILIDKRQDTIRVVVEDDGVGFQPEEIHHKSLGLQGIRERTALFGGTFTIESQPGQGTSLFVVLPYPPNSAENSP